MRYIQNEYFLWFRVFVLHSPFSPHIVSFKFFTSLSRIYTQKKTLPVSNLILETFSLSLLYGSLLRFLTPMYTYPVPTEADCDLEQWFSIGDDFAPEGTFGNV